MTDSRQTNRRTVLKTIGAGALGAAAVTGTATAEEEQHYGQGNGLDEFLNEEALLKDNPIWDGEIANRMGEDVVDVAVGAMTSVDIPDALTPPGVPVPEALPVAFAPHVVKVSPGATVRWTWVSNPLGHPIPHDVTSLVDDDGNVVLKEDGGQRYHHHDQYTPATEDNELEEDVNPTHETEFSEHGNHLYYCTPHGSPFSLGTVTHPGTGEEIEFINEFGMRGAVKVAGRALRD